MPPALRIALLSPCFWPEVRRGGERFVRELANGLIALGQAPSLITSHSGPRTRVQEAGLPITRMRRPPQGWLVRHGFLPYLTHVPYSFRELRRQHPDVAHAVYPSDALAAVPWGGPSVFSYLGIPEPAGMAEHRLGRAVLTGAIRRAGVNVALSQYAARAFVELGVEPRVIPPGVDLQTFQPATVRSPEPTIVCSAAPEVPRKHVGLLVQAFARVRRELPDARLILSRPSSFAAVAAAGVPRQSAGVEWRDLNDTRVLVRTLGEAWVSVLPSTHEAFGLVLVEALACGTPVLGHEHAAIPEIIDRPGIGRLFGRLEVPELAEALLEMLEHAPTAAEEERCRARAEEFSRRRFAEAYLQLYRELV